MKQSRVSSILGIFMIACMAVVVAGCTTGSNIVTSATPTAAPAISTSIAIYGNVSNPMNISISDLQNYPQVSVSDHQYGAHQSTYVMSATGASLNAILDAAKPKDGTMTVVFTGSDGFSSTAVLPDIRADNQSMIVSTWTTNDTTAKAGPEDSLRVIIPSQTYAQSWVFDLVSIEVQ